MDRITGTAWNVIQDDDAHEPNNEMNNEISTEIKFEISAESYGYDEDEAPRPSRTSGIIRAATAEAARWALGAALSMFLAKREKSGGER
ncbi:MAG: hypothetical protein FWH44_05535 [Methanomassiliicoccaceae archaeon]|nr:hypothetical protein [Methanomassiliicoccaceae archaeon]